MTAPPAGQAPLRDCAHLLKFYGVIVVIGSALGMIVGAYRGHGMILKQEVETPWLYWVDAGIAAHGVMYFLLGVLLSRRPRLALRLALVLSVALMLGLITYAIAFETLVYFEIAWAILLTVAVAVTARRLPAVS